MAARNCCLTTGSAMTGAASTACFRSAHGRASQRAFTLGEWTEPRAGEVLGRLAVTYHADGFMVAAVMSSAVPHARALVDSAVRAGDPVLASLSEPLVNLTLGLNQRDALAVLLL